MIQKFKQKSFFVSTGGILLLLIFQFFNFSISYAANIDVASKYAWGENIGWINFQNVQVDNLALTGWAWAENAGWISLSCENTNTCATGNYGVSNDGNGNLSGYAWNENLGWISFNCANTNTCATGNFKTTIDAQGNFQGWAWAENAGWISLSCENTNTCTPALFGVKTTWRPGGGGDTTAPVANAGPDITVTDIDNSGAENVTLNQGMNGDKEGFYLQREQSQQQR
ncbi:MAG: hypothetical protein UU76_C0033G0003 [Parcubacteria group bacterium GW2011_GWC1_41_7]|nr:MAG: hypothetical protein UU76_C0033G0003 [Parcubacteria group bacterium GW2011_GWC1_41_7]